MKYPLPESDGARKARLIYEQEYACHMGRHVYFGPFIWEAMQNGKAGGRRRCTHCEFTEVKIEDLGAY